MSDKDVRLVRLPPMQVAVFHALGADPELEVWRQYRAWAEPRGEFDLQKHRVFGFDNPMSTPDTPDHGYELWVEIGDGAAVPPGTEVKSFGGGEYAVEHCEVRGDPYAVIPQTWGQLDAWLQTSHYTMGSHQWLELALTPPDNPSGEWDMDLYLPIAR